MRRILLALWLLIPLSASPTPAVAEPGPSAVSAAPAPQQRPLVSWNEEFFWDARYDSQMTPEQAQLLRQTIERYDTMIMLVDTSHLVLRVVDGEIVPIRYDDLLTILGVEIMTGQMTPDEATIKVNQLRQRSRGLAQAMYERRRTAMDRLARIEARLARSGSNSLQSQMTAALRNVVVAALPGAVPPRPAAAPSVPAAVPAPSACPSPSRWLVQVTTADFSYTYGVTLNPGGEAVFTAHSGDRLHHIQGVGRISGNQLSFESYDTAARTAGTGVFTLTPDCMGGTGAVRAERAPGGLDFSGTAVIGRYL